MILQTSTPKNHDLLNSDATRRAVRRHPVISFTPRPPRPSPTIHPQQRAFLRYLRKLLPSRTNAVPPVRINQARDPLDFPATSPLPPNYSSSAQATTHGLSYIKSNENSPSTRPPPATQSSADAPTAFKSRVHHLSTWWPVRTRHVPLPIVDVPLAWGKPRYAAAGAPTRNEDLIRDEDYVPPPPPNPDSQQQSAAAHVTTGEHGSDRLCGCF
ncbi:hypothetical protein DFH29DRAFT_1068387 [Suillus ampliporus]|nr:hypothetical protein DFH29DRAFT_1068387 [Suillus ampliporus]